MMGKGFWVRNRGIEGESVKVISRAADIHRHDNSRMRVIGKDMNGRANKVEFYGILGRSTSRDSAIQLRFYPRTFSTAPSGKYVLVVTFDGASFQESEVAPLIGEEIEGTFFDDRAEMVAISQSLTLTLRARAISTEWCTYDAADFVRRVDELDAAYERLNSALTKAVQKNRKSAALAHELLRRANIKAQSSADQAEKQAPAVAVLERLVRQLESDD